MKDGKTVKMSVITTALLGVILTSLVIITIVGNVLVCLSVCLVRKLRKPQNYLLVSLAVSDLFVALFVMPFAIVLELNADNWPLSDGLCDLWVSADVLSCTASILNLCAISVDRWTAISKPLEYAGATSPRRMLAVIFAVWLSAACVSLPPVLLLGNEHENHKCTVSQNFWYQIYATMVSFYVPLCVMVVVYAKILRVVAEKKKQMTWANNSRNSSVDRTAMHMDMPYLHQEEEEERNRLNSPSTSRHNHNRQDHSGGMGCSGGNTTDIPHPSRPNPHQLVLHHEQGHQQPSLTSSGDESNGHSFRSLQKYKPVKLKDHKASTTLGIIMSAFIICWLPFFVLAIIRPFLEGDQIPATMSSLFLWLGYFNSSLNPAIYCIRHEFLLPFKEILCCRCKTLDSLMRREFYLQQFGGDEYCVRNKKKVPVVTSALSPVSETNILPINPKINNTNINVSDSPLVQRSQSQPQSQMHTPLKLQKYKVGGSPNFKLNGQDGGHRVFNNVNKTFETQITTDAEDETDDLDLVGGEEVTFSAI